MEHQGILNRTWLPPGGVIRVVAPAAAVQKQAFERGVTRLEKFGYSVKFRDDVMAKDCGGYAGSLQRRFEELVEAFEDDSCQAIFCARGGFGSLDLLPLLQKKGSSFFAQHSRVFCGLSDITALLSFFSGQCQIPCIHGPLVASTLDPEISDTVWRYTLDLAAGKTVSVNDLLLESSGFDVAVSAQTVGGNLCILQHLAGTPSLPSVGGKLLYLEEINEPRYRMERAFSHLQQVGFFNGVKAILLGGLGLAGKDEKEFVARCLTANRISWVSGIRIGHHWPYLPLPFNGFMRLDARAGRLKTSLNQAVED